MSSEPPTRRFSLNNTDDLINYIDSSTQIQEMLAIDESIGYGVYRDVLGDYYVVADYSYVTWGSVLNKPFLDMEENFHWGRFEPKKEDWDHWHYHIRTLLSGALSGALGVSIHPNSITYRIRRNSPKAKVYKVIPL